MPRNEHTEVIEVYRDIKIIRVNLRQPSTYISVEYNGIQSALGLTSVKAARNVIDTYLRSLKQ